MKAAYGRMIVNIRIIASNFSLCNSLRIFRVAKGNFLPFLQKNVRKMSDIDNNAAIRYSIWVCVCTTVHRNDRRKGGRHVSSFALRLAALLCMFLDHIGLALFPAVGAFRCVGRLAFPLYCFLLAQGYRHTRSRSAYGRKLLLLALLSEVPSDLLIFGRMVSFVEQNVLFSLLLSLLALYAVDSLKGRPLAAWAAVMSVCVCAMAANVSYGWLGPVLCLCAHYGRSSRTRLAASMGGALLLYSASLALSGVTASWVLVSLCALFALIPLLMYNGRPGPRFPALSFLFYAAYPLHLIALIIVRTMRIIPPYFLS